MDHGEAAREVADLAEIAEPNRKRLQLQAAFKSRREAQRFTKRFGGRIAKLPRDWLQRFAGQQKLKPIVIAGKRLRIPAGAAFGTGEHATTAMSLKMLERVMNIGRDGSPTRPSNASNALEKRPYHLVVDLGTGSGILALAARLLGAKSVVAIDSDPDAIRTAKENARLNKIDMVKLELADVRRWKSRGKIDIVTANLYSDLLIELLPKLNAIPWLILSGILRNQEDELARALRRCKIDIVEVRRRGQWIAVLARQLRRS
jgi:ribosomal protein L11 methyltransferase